MAVCPSPFAIDSSAIWERASIVAFMPQVIIDPYMDNITPHFSVC
jgi:hypothetical protein